MRFIPAGAGNTVPSGALAPVASVYPCWRGEHVTLKLIDGIGFGLSPLARGTRLAPYGSQVKARFIPAGAGNTLAWRIRKPHLSVYPRWRGEHLQDRVSQEDRPGLSPLARGTPMTAQQRYINPRFIPAGAGNTPKTVAYSATDTVYPRWRGEHSKHNLLLINDFLSQSQSTNFIVSHKQHIHYVKEHLIH
ncbi:hypothetical protein ECMP0215612_3593 [Escherichia coli MP021561.2]|nr:hypothetical protein ECMP0215612_3593 [Escherichia coli MP021561.2]